MPPLYEQRANLIAANTDLILQWLSLLTPEHQRNVIESMVRRFTLPQLRTMRAHVAGEVATQLAKLEEDRPRGLRHNGRGGMTP